jgi:hypothetical protein
MATTEKLHFKVTLSGTYWDKVPEYSILINNTQIQRAQLTQPTDQEETIEFDVELADDEFHDLKIRLENKTDSDTVENQDKTAILRDMMLNIQKIEIDEIDLGNLISSKSLYTGDDASRPVLDKCVNLGWNGTWVLQFRSPFYIWLLENI